LKAHEKAIASRPILKRLSLSKGGYFLATLHRAENVDDRERLTRLMSGLALTAGEFDLPVVVSVHPRTADKIKKAGLKVDKKKIVLMPPIGFLDFVKLEMNARAVMTDSGTVQEECCIFSVPNVTLRDVTERPETLECGSNILTGSDPQFIKQAVDVALSQYRPWAPPPEYMETNVSSTVAKIVLGYHHRSS
jgi:UDP-N-acetylglucosamine 2-epimerase (non-hydrolysing)